MRIPGICVICSDVAEPAHTCSMCGAIVCSKHFVKEHNMCTNCYDRIKNTSPMGK
jgi:hypothetical protein